MGLINELVNAQAQAASVQRRQTKGQTGTAELRARRGNQPSKRFHIRLPAPHFVRLLTLHFLAF